MATGLLKVTENNPITKQLILREAYQTSMELKDHTDTKIDPLASVRYFDEYDTVEVSEEYNDLVIAGKEGVFKRFNLNPIEWNELPRYRKEIILRACGELNRYDHELAKKLEDDQKDKAPDTDEL